MALEVVLVKTKWETRLFFCDKGYLEKMADGINQVLMNQSNAIASFHDVKGREQRTDFNHVIATATIVS
jgi:hypothetical protein